MSSPASEAPSLVRWSVRLCGIALFAVFGALALGYLNWILGCKRVAEKIIAPFKYVMEHPPDTNLLIIFGLLLFVAILGIPIYLFILNLEEGPLGTKTRKQYPPVPTPQAASNPTQGTVSQPSAPAAASEPAPPPEPPATAPDPSVAPVPPEPEV